MKKIITFCFFCIAAFASIAQKTKGIDVSTGKTILNLLPVNLQGQNTNAKNDKVVAGLNLIGVTVHRDYGIGAKKIAVEVINNALSTATVNSIIANPTSNNYKVVQINGYNSLLQSYNGEASKMGYELFIPVNTTLITLKAFNYSQDQFLTMAQNIPVGKIAHLVE